MTDKEQSETIDKILNALTNLDGQGKSANKLANELKVDKNSILHLCELLSNNGFTKNISPTHDEFDKTFFIEPKGEHKLKIGGFLKDFEAESNRKEQDESDKELNRNKLKWDIRKHKLWFITSIFTGIYFVTDLVLRVLFESDIVAFLFRLFFK